MKGSGMFALSEPGKLEDVLASAGLTPYEDEEIECPIVFADVEAAERAFLGQADAAGDRQLRRSGGRRGGACRARGVQRSRRPSCAPPAYRAVLAQG